MQASSIHSWVETRKKKGRNLLSFNNYFLKFVGCCFGSILRPPTFFCAHRPFFCAHYSFPSAPTGVEIT